VHKLQALLTPLENKQIAAAEAQVNDLKQEALGDAAMAGVSVLFVCTAAICSFECVTHVLRNIM
jgi:hypothetical protein